MITHLLNTRVDVHRVTLAADGAGGQTETRALVGTLPAMVAQPSARELTQAGKWAAQLTNVVYFEPPADVRRGDELRRGAEVYRVLALVEPSRAAYVKAYAERMEPEGT